MGEFHGQILGILLVVAIFAVLLTPMETLFKDLVTSVEGEITEYIDSDYKIGE